MLACIERMYNHNSEENAVFFSLYSKCQCQTSGIEWDVQEVVDLLKTCDYLCKTSPAVHMVTFCPPLAKMKETPILNQSYAHCLSTPPPPPQEVQLLG